jgi:hypothetical protein
LSPKERIFLENQSPFPQESINFSCRYEAAWVLLWALSYVDTLGMPGTCCDPARAFRYMKDRTAVQFISGSRLRPLGEMLDEADLIFRYSWAVVDARIKQETSPAGLDSGVIYERHYALNWLIGYMDQEWDSISTDT